MVIDIHSHAVPDFLVEALNAAGLRPALSGYPDWTADLAVRQMDRFGIDKTILSLSAPGLPGNDPEAWRALARRYNTLCADLRETTGRFGAFAALPLPDVEGACLEAVHALDEIKLEGVGLLGSYGDIYLGEDKYAPLMAELDARAARVFLHPVGDRATHAVNLDFPIWMLEYPFSTSRAALNLIMSGTTLRYPNIRWLLAHNGGTLPFLRWRINSVSLIDSRYGSLPENHVQNELSKFYYDIAQSPADNSLLAVLQTTDPSHILFGTDWPYCREEVTQAILDSLAQSEALPAARMHEVMHKNAAAFLA